MLGVGIIAHELGHTGYNFVDTYDYGNLTGGNRSSGHGFWSLMASGSWGRRSFSENSGDSPAFVDAFNLVSRGIVTPGRAVDDETVALSTALCIYRICTPDDDQYFLIQQRSFGAVSNFDRGAFFPISFFSNPDHGGALIFHVDELVEYAFDRTNLRPFDKPHHYLAAILEAHGGDQHLQQRFGGNSGDLGDLWGVEQHVFSSESDPSSHLYGRPVTLDLTPPTRDTESGVHLVGIQWCNLTRTTVFTMDGTPR